MNSTLNQVKLTLQKLLLKFGESQPDKGLLSYIGDDLEIGAAVYLGDDIAPDGDYEVADANLIIRVVDGKVAEIVAKEEEVPVEEEIEVEAAEEEAPAAEEAPAEEVPVEEAPDMQAIILEILKPVTEKMANLEARLGAVEARLQEIETKLLEAQAKPADEAIESVEIEPESGFFRAGHGINNRK